jgi:hypothetical protein
MRAATAAFALTSLLAVGAHAAADDVVLTLPHKPRAGEQVVLAVTVGSIGHRRVEVTTASGQRVGTISAFGPQAAQSGGTYMLPVRPDAIQDDRLEVRVTISGNGGHVRSPTAEEVKEIRLTMTGP